MRLGPAAARGSLRGSRALQGRDQLVLLTRYRVGTGVLSVNCLCTFLLRLSGVSHVGKSVAKAANEQESDGPRSIRSGRRRRPAWCTHAPLVLLNTRR